MADAEILTPRERGYSNLKPVQPGEVRNPLGAGAPAASLAAYIRRTTRDGRDLIDFLLKVISGEERMYQRVADKLVAVSELLDRGWGKAPQTILMNDNGKLKPVFDLTKLTAAEFEQFKSLASKIGPAVDSVQESHVGQSVDTSTASPEPSGTTISPSRDPNPAP